jgi:GNAT superfamily N-acetyltransferase
VAFVEVEVSLGLEHGRGVSAAMPLQIEPATPADVPEILDFIKALAEYEKLSDRVVATEDGLRASLFGPRPAAEVVFARAGGERVGFALFFESFSTFVGKRGLYLEDLFIRPEHRGKGYGKALLVHLARLAVARGCGRFEWSALDWNAPAIGFYEKLGAERMKDWILFRLSGAALETLARGDAGR